MGQTGMISRLLAPKFGGYLTFGALSKGQESAPGQPTVQDLIEVYRYFFFHCYITPLQVVCILNYKRIMCFCLQTAL